MHNNIDEEMFFFMGSNNRSLLGFLHYPRSNQRSTGIVYCHPFAEEKNMSHSVAVKASRAFAEIGFPVFRFDMSGCGDSQGNLDEIHIGNWQEDISCAIHQLRDKAGIQKYALWGLRMGGGLCMLHAVHDHNVSFVLLWEPVLNLKASIDQFLRRQISSQLVLNKNKTADSAKSFAGQIKEEGALDVIGYPISKTFYESLEAVPSEPENLKLECPTLLLSISLMNRPTFSLNRYVDCQIANRASLTFQHIKAEPFWDRYWRWECQEVVDYSKKWLGGF